MTASVGAAGTTFPALGTTATVLVTEPDRLDEAEHLLRHRLGDWDEACSRFRPDSEISRLHRAAGTERTVGPLLADALDAALRAARITGGLVDPTVGDAVRELGYDRDFAAVDPELPAGPPARPAPGWWRIAFDRPSRRVLLPRGIALDLGATAKALIADRTSAELADLLGCGVLVGLGGDIAIAGEVPEPGWRIAVGDDHRTAAEDPDTVVTIVTGALATSSTTCRTWRRGGRTVHHIVDPRTGDVPVPVWRTVTVAARTCVDANTASTAAIVLGGAAANWLDTLRLPARLVSRYGDVLTVGGWRDTP